MSMSAVATHFKAIQFQIMDYCNRSCSFCPNTRNARKTRAMMSEHVLYRILDDLADMGFEGRVSPYLFNEPLLDPRVFAIMSAVRRRLPDNVIFLNSNGDALRDDSFKDRFARCDIDGIHLNCYDDEKAYRGMLALVERMAQEHSRIRVHTSGSLRLLPSRNGFINVKVVWIPSARPNFWNRGGNAQGVGSTLGSKTKVACEFPFEQMYINHLGQAILCCSDWHFEVVMGDIRKSSIGEIWGDDIYQRYRFMHAAGLGRQLKLCNTCNRMTRGKPHMHQSLGAG